MPRSIHRTLLLIALFLPLGPAVAWGDYAHRLTGRIALDTLTPAARAELDRLLAANAQLGTKQCPMRSLADAAGWPDCVRGLGERYAYAARWHYQNIPRCAAFDFTAACPDANCLTAQIERQLAVLANRHEPVRARLQALGFVAHFIGDLHQPLHVADSGDRGGNSVRVSYGYDRSANLNLHRIWDRELTERTLTDPPVLTPIGISPAQRTQWSKGSLIDWTRQSWALSSTLVYGKLPVLASACTAPPAQMVAIDDSYFRAVAPAIRAQVGRAGVRLGVVLNRALGQ